MAKDPVFHFSVVGADDREEFFNGLRFLGRETQMVRYPREPHIFIEKEHQRDSLERMLRWYDAHLRQ